MIKTDKGQIEMRGNMARLSQTRSGTLLLRTEYQKKWQRKE